MKHILKEIEGISRASEQIQRINRDILNLARMTEDRKEEIDINRMLNNLKKGGKK